MAERDADGTLRLRPSESMQSIVCDLVDKDMHPQRIERYHKRFKEPYSTRTSDDISAGPV